METTDSIFEDYWFVLADIGQARSSNPGLRPSAGAMRKALLSAVIKKPQVMVKITSFGKSHNLSAHLDYISRLGKNEVFDQSGTSFNEIGDSQALTARSSLQAYGSELANDPFATAGMKQGRPRSRVSMNMMLSMPPGTDTGAFELSVRDFLAENFSHYDHVFTFHDDTAHYHAHVVVSLKGYDGSWLNPRKEQLASWRKRFAANLERRGIPAKAIPAYSRGHGKDGYRRDLEELKRRGKRQRYERSPSFDAEKEALAIEKRAEAWNRLAHHCGKGGDLELESAIRRYVADHYDHPLPRKNKPDERER